MMLAERVTSGRRLVEVMVPICVHLLASIAPPWLGKGRAGGSVEGSAELADHQLRETAFGRLPQVTGSWSIPDPTEVMHMQKDHIQRGLNMAEKGVGENVHNTRMQAHRHTHFDMAPAEVELGLHHAMIIADYFLAIEVSFIKTDQKVWQLQRAILTWS